MNIKSVLRVYSQLRNLTDDETALLETLRRFTDAEREAFVEALQPQKVAKKASKKASSKSPSRRGLSPQAREGLRAATTFCAVENCGLNESSGIHDPAMGYAGYHEFQPAESQLAHGAGGD